MSASYRSRRFALSLKESVREGLMAFISVALVSWLLPGIVYESALALLLAALILSLLNAVLRPLLIFFTLPFIIVTAGLGLVLINAVLLLLVSGLTPGFAVTSFWTALGAAIIMGLFSLIMRGLLLPGGFQVYRGGPPRQGGGGGRRRGDDKVIDV